MNSNFIRQRHDPQHTVAKLLHASPISHAIIGLHLDPDRVFNYEYTPFLLQIRSLSHNLIQEIVCVLILAHLSVDNIHLRLNQ